MLWPLEHGFYQRDTDCITLLSACRRGVTIMFSKHLICSRIKGREGVREVLTAPLISMGAKYTVWLLNNETETMHLKSCGWKKKKAWQSKSKALVVVSLLDEVTESFWKPCRNERGRSCGENGFLHRDSVPAHTALIEKQFLTQNTSQSLSTPPCLI